jgi:L-cystine transport system substrate-binding protein
MKNNLRKSFVALFALLAALSTVSCGSTDSGSASSASSASSAGSASDTPTADNPRTILISVNNDSNPDSFLDENGEYTGYEPEMLKLIDELLPEYEFEYTSISSTDALLALETDKIDASLQRWEDNEERRKKYLFSNEYYLTYTQNLTTWDNDSSISSLDDLAGKNIWVKAAGGSDDYFWQTYNNNHPDAQVNLVYATGGYSVVIPMFEDGELDAATMVQRNVDRINENYNAKFTTVGDTIMSSDTYILFNLDETTLRDRVDEALQQIRADGKLTELSLKWYGADYSIDPYKEN